MVPAYLGDSYFLCLFILNLALLLYTDEIQLNLPVATPWGPSEIDGPILHKLRYDKSSGSRAPNPEHRSPSQNLRALSPSNFHLWLFFSILFHGKTVEFLSDMGSYDTK